MRAISQLLSIITLPAMTRWMAETPGSLVIMLWAAKAVTADLYLPAAHRIRKEGDPAACHSLRKPTRDWTFSSEGGIRMLVIFPGIPILHGEIMGGQGVIPANCPNLLKFLFFRPPVVDPGKEADFGMVLEDIFPCCPAGDMDTGPGPVPMKVFMEGKNDILGCTSGESHPFMIKSRYMMAEFGNNPDILGLISSRRVSISMAVQEDRTVADITRYLWNEYLCN